MTYSEAQGVLRALVNEAVAQKSDVYYEHKVPEVARVAVSVFDDNHRTQMKNLENIALNARALADVLNYVKSQAGKDKSLWPKDDFARILIEAFETTVINDADKTGSSIWKALRNVKREAEEALKDGNYNEADLKRNLRLQFGRMFVLHLVAHYTYAQKVER